MKTFASDEGMVIIIPIGSIRNARGGQLMPENFQCRYKDTYKVFVINGKPKPLGAAQVITGVFILTLGLIFTEGIQEYNIIYTLPSVLFVVSGMVSYAAGLSPHMRVAKLSFSLNIISFLWSIVAVSFCAMSFTSPHPTLNQLHKGITGLIMTLLVVEKLIALFLIYWLSTAVCREHFNSLPIILLKQQD